jgi:hypothetical protein
MPRTAVLFLLAAAQAAALDLTKAVLVYPSSFSGPEKKAATMLVEEVEKRAQTRWQTASVAPADAPSIVLEKGHGPAEGYRISSAGHTVHIAGDDSRGVLFGVGRLLRTLRMEKESVQLPDGFAVASAPKYALRGHQTGYRPKTNAYDAWSVAMWEQYIRDLVVFGANAIELIPPRSDDDADSPHFPLPPMRMMIEMSRLADEYGLDVWVWYPAMDKDYADPRTVEFALQEWGEVFRQLPRIDAIFVPGGDPGHTQPKYLMHLLEKETEVLRRYHPCAQMWVSPQSFNRAWLDEFLDILKNQQPAWLAGVVFGPQVAVSLPQLRAAVPRRYPIRHYPDITHSRQCQYPVPDWDVAYAVTEERETINPRPVDEARIFRLLQPFTIGFLTYSEGANDDVNKMIWSALGWDPEADVTGILREYSRYFIGPSLEEGFAQGLLALERNWRGPLATNGGVNSTLESFQAMEQQASPALKHNWRFQQALYRAYYDAYTRTRLIHEADLEARAMDKLRAAPWLGSELAMREAQSILDRAVLEPVAEDWCSRVFDLAEALFQSVRMQLSVPRYQAIAVERGANLDTLNAPLNNRVWLEARFDELRRNPDEKERLAGIAGIVSWTNPGPGGFYDDLGDPARQPHLVRGPGAAEDPAFLESSPVGFAYHPAWRSSWWTHAGSLNDTPLELRYQHLDAVARYKVRVVYGGDSPTRKIRLEAGGGEVHPFLTKPAPARPLEFDIPPQATSKGELNLRWYREPGLGGNGRGCQVSEVWLIRK